MKLVQSSKEMQELALQIRSDGKSIGLVPTMGCLHEGHLSLCRVAGPRCDVLVVSIFVNPTQFSANEDLESYPRDLKSDMALCRNEQVDVVFNPAPEDVYSPDHSTCVEEHSLSEDLCGRSRPTHFRGVTTIVAWLFNMVQPSVAVFGQKDAQQARVIERMSSDLGFPVEIAIAPIVREPDGLAMSSRNRYLSAEQRESALCLSRALDLARKLVATGTLSSAAIRERMDSLVEGTASAEVDYIEIVDLAHLRPVEHIGETTLVAMAVKIGDVRLIDNTIVSAESGAQPVPWPQP